MNTRSSSSIHRAPLINGSYSTASINREVIYEWRERTFYSFAYPLFIQCFLFMGAIVQTERAGIVGTLDKCVDILSAPNHLTLRPTPDVYLSASYGRCCYPLMLIYIAFYVIVAGDNPQYFESLTRQNYAD